MIFAIGKRIATLRRRAGLSQATLAKQLGVSAGALGMYEQGRREPSLDTIVAVCSIFGVTSDYLLTGHVQNVQDCSVVLGSSWERIVDLTEVLLQGDCDSV